MNAAPKAPAGLIADANVLIDYAGSDRSVLSLISQHVGKISVPSPVFDEARAISEGDAASLGIEIVEPTLDQAVEATAGDGPTSFEDRLCLVVARDKECRVLTNDTALRKACGDAGVACVWGLEAMALLADGGHLTAKRAMTVAEGMAKSNRFITTRLLQQFRKRIGL
jgi:predicted nucleic acid-binding protein